MKVFIDGREGTTGLRIEERLCARRDIELLPIDDTLRKDPAERKRKIDEADVVFLCLPDAAAVEAVQMADGEQTIIIDASTAHRTESGWAYGLPELSSAHRAAIENGKRIAVPGCHASGFSALVYPMIASELMSKEHPIVCHSVTGYSGGGKKMIAQYENDDRPGEYDSPRQYGLTQNHKHLKEMQAVSGLTMPPVFTPIVADFYSGMVVTVPVFAGLLSKKAGLTEIHELFAKHYENQPMVTVLPLDADKSFLGANNLSGRDDMEVFISGNDERILLTARFDNLGKGASGAAVQCMNIALGLDETMSLML